MDSSRMLSLSRPKKHHRPTPSHHAHAPSSRVVCPGTGKRCHPQPAKVAGLLSQCFLMEMLYGYGFCFIIYTLMFILYVQISLYMYTYMVYIIYYILYNIYILYHIYIYIYIILYNIIYYKYYKYYILYIINFICYMYDVMLCYITIYCVICMMLYYGKYYIILHYIILYYIILYYITLYMLCYVMLYHIILFYIILYIIFFYLYIILYICVLIDIYIFAYIQYIHMVQTFWVLVKWPKIPGGPPYHFGTCRALTNDLVLHGAIFILEKIWRGHVSRLAVWPECDILPIRCICEVTLKYIIMNENFMSKGQGPAFSWRFPTEFETSSNPSDPVIKPDAPRYRSMLPSCVQDATNIWQAQRTGKKTMDWIGQ